MARLMIIIINFNRKHNKNVILFLKNILYNITFTKVNHLKFLYYLHLFHTN